jgi:hypothetical protein
VGLPITIATSSAASLADDLDLEDDLIGGRISCTVSANDFMPLVGFSLLGAAISVFTPNVSISFHGHFTQFYYVLCASHWTQPQSGRAVIGPW